VEGGPSIQINDVGQDIFQPFTLQTCLDTTSTSGENEDVLRIRKERRKRRNRDSRRTKDSMILIDSESSRKDAPRKIQLSVVKDCGSSEVSFDIKKSG
jgi:hypothetical protein